jgi:hypothetical protein
VVGCSVGVYVPHFPRCCGMGWGSKCWGEMDCQLHQSTGACPVTWESLMKGPPQYHQISALPTESVGCFVKLLKDWLSMYSIRFPTFVSCPPVWWDIWSVIDI